MIPIASYYLGASSTPQIAYNRPQSMSQASLQQHSPTASTQKVSHTANRASMPPPSRNTANSPPAAASPPNVKFEPPQEADEGEESDGQRAQESTSTSPPPRSGDAHKRTSSMKRDFKFPPTSPPSTDGGSPKTSEDAQQLKGHIKAQESVISPASIEVPPPPPVEKERLANTVDDGEDEVGDTVEVPLN